MYPYAARVRASGQGLGIERRTRGARASGAPGRALLPGRAASRGATDRFAADDELDAAILLSARR